MLRNLETITIKIEHKVYDESICYDYLFSVLTKVYASCTDFINSERNKRKEPRLFEHVEKYAKKWERDIKMKREH